SKATCHSIPMQVAISPIVVMCGKSQRMNSAMPWGWDIHSTALRRCIPMPTSMDAAQHCEMMMSRPSNLSIPAPARRHHRHHCHHQQARVLYGATLMEMAEPISAFGGGQSGPGKF